MNYLTDKKFDEKMSGLHGFIGEQIEKLEAIRNPVEAVVIQKIAEREGEIIEKLIEKNPRVKIIIDIKRPVGEGYTLKNYCTYTITDGYNKILLESGEVRAEDCIKKAKAKALSNFSA